MERKIGEIFEYNGKWYQCVEEYKECDECSLRIDGLCTKDGSKFGYCNQVNRLDKKSVIFKKFEKVGEPFERNGYMYQEYKTHTYPLLMSGGAKIPTPNGFAVIIKNKEDMKTVKISQDDLSFLVDKIRYGILPKHIDYDKITNEISKLFSINNIEDSNSEKIGKNLKPFDLQAAKSGKPVCTRDGRKARIVCFDAIGYHQPIIALVTNFDGKEDIETYYLDGRFNDDIADISDYDLMMLSEKKEGWINLYWEDGMIEDCTCVPYATREEALDNISDPRFVTTVKIPWEE